MTDDISRRGLISGAAALGTIRPAAPFLASLAGISEAAAATATDYKALVCVFLFGGNDHYNTVVPFDGTGTTGQYGAYAQGRPALAYDQASLAPNLLQPDAPLAANGNSANPQFALAPGLAPLLPLWNAGRMGVLLNVGTLVAPTTKASYAARSVALPPRLMSHNDQQSYWQASSVEGAVTGWGGRIGDLFATRNGNPALTCITPSGNAVFLSGKSVVQYTIGPSGPTALSARSSLSGSTAAANLLTSLIAGGGPHQLETIHGGVGDRALKLYNQIAATLSSAPATATPFPAAADTSSSLGQQLQMVAKLISISAELGLKRQVFFVSSGRFDTHSGLQTVHPLLLRNLADAMRAFHDTTVELGVADRVTTFTASDFGRTLASNNDGSDHGWGAHHFVMGGAVKGRRFYGSAPTLANNGPDDIGQGRLIPGLAVSQYAATLAAWFGVPASSLAEVLPGLANFSTAPLGVDLGFLR